MVGWTDHAAVPEAPIQKATRELAHTPVLALSVQSSSTDSFMVGECSATPRINHHQLVRGYNGPRPVADARILLPGHLRRNVTCPSNLPSEGQHNQTASVACEPASSAYIPGPGAGEHHERLQLKWQQQQDWLEQHGRANCGFINPERLLQHQQRSRSLRILSRNEPHSQDMTFVEGKGEKHITSSGE